MWAEAKPEFFVDFVNFCSKRLRSLRLWADAPTHRGAPMRQMSCLGLRLARYAEQPVAEYNAARGWWRWQRETATARAR
jgi:hypothetical protein